ncbi:MAG: isoleucine--tRNA ligase [Lactovum sp.]
MKIKDSLHLGKTDFPMRAGLPTKEPKLQELWQAADLYQKRQEINKGKPPFILHDGPPYANGNIHVGHSLNKISKDIITRYKSMSGFFSPYIPGWDTHGLPIEQQLTKQGVKRKEIPRAEYLDLCRDYALSQVDLQRTDFKSLGVLADWENPYITLNPDYEAAQVRVFGAMAEKGYIYRGAKPIYWSPSSESSLAEAEIEYADVESPSLYIAFKAMDVKGKLPEDTEFIIWTTTAWTLPSNRGIFVHPEFDYILVKVQNRKFLVAKDLVEKISEKLSWDSFEVLQTIKGSELEEMKMKHPFYDRASLVMLADYVTLDSGTGLVHSSPSHGEDDYFYSRKYKLPVIEDIDDQGFFTEEAEGFEGKFYAKVQEEVLEKLNSGSALLSFESFIHSYPHDWRTKKPVIYRALPQWFASIDDFRENILEEIEKVNWVIPWGKTRLYNMVRDRGDWVISRQRAWGLPLPIFYAEDGSAIISSETIEYVASLFEEFGSKVWFEREAKDLLPEGFSHPSSPNGIFTKETDIMDVWFDSGSSWNGVLNGRSELSYPSDLYLEGSDQYRGWFNSSITTSVAVNGIAPYKAVLSQGFVLDGKGRKMSKSLGNVILPSEVTKKLGADILRLWVASVDYESDVRVSMEILNQVAEQYKKIRNSLRFLIANSFDFTVDTDTINFEDLSSVDKYSLVKFSKLVGKIHQAYDSYNFMMVYKEITNFLTDLSGFYLDFAKDIVYIEKANSSERRGMQTVFHKILVDLTKLLVPILPHTSEEVWSYLTEKEEFAYLSELPQAQEYSDQISLEENWENFMIFRDQVLKALENAREEKLIGRSQEAKVTVFADSSVSQVFKDLDENIARLLIVSDFEFSEEKNLPEEALKFENLSILVEKAQGEVCERCRRLDITVGENSEFSMLCNHCIDIVRSEFPELKSFDF